MKYNVIYTDKIENIDITENKEVFSNKNNKN